MKKKLLIICFNIILILIFLFCFNIILPFYSNYKYNSTTETPKESITKIWKFITRKIDKNEAYATLIQNPFHNYFRKVENPNNKDKKPIIIFGCSFAYGSDLEENQTFSYKLGKLTGRPVYNRAMGGIGVQHMLYQLQNEDFYKLVPEPEYVIYAFFEGHYSRMFTPICTLCEPSYIVFYKQDKNKNFILKKRNFLFDRFIVQHLLRNEILRPKLENIPCYQKYLDKMLFDYIIASKKEIDKHWEGVKFVMFMFEKPFTKEIMQKLKDNGIIIISEDDYGFNMHNEKEKYMNTLHKDHPGEIFWDTVTPIMIDKLGMNK